MFVRSVWDVMCDADPAYRHQEAQCWNGFFDVLLQAPDMVAVVQWSKYLIAWPMAKFLRQEMPEIPTGIVEAMGGSNLHFPLSGGARRHFRNQIASRSSEARPAQVMWAILQGSKRGCAEVPEIFIELTMRKHQKALTQELPKLSEEDKELFRQKFRDLWRDRSTWLSPEGRLYKTWGKSRQMVVDVGRDANPSFRATATFTRQDNGRCGQVRSAWIDECVKTGAIPPRRYFKTSDPGPREALNPLYLTERSFVSALCLKNESYLHAMVERRPGEVVEVRVSENCLPRVDKRWSVRIALQELQRYNGRCQAVVAGILEPLKCRLITKGSGMSYFAAQPMQRALWERLQKFPAFKLTGCPLDESMLEGVDMLTRKLGLAFDKWVSGDYSAATDGLSQEINALCLEEAILACNLSDDEARIARAVLGNHDIHYPGTTPDKSGKVRYDIPSDIKQTNGQLMGSVLSFPVLCAINVAAYWIALEAHTGRKFGVHDLPVLVNGDDILFKASDEFYSVWKHWTRVAGFTLSPGKNYISPDFLTVNSAGFVYKPGKNCPTFKKVGFLNTGLLYSGRSVERRVEFDGSEPEVKDAKVGQRAETREMPFTAKVNAVINDSCDPKRTLLRVHEFYRGDIRHHTRNGEINMHAAPELGGLGIVLPVGAETRFTAWQQKVAGYLRHKWKSGSFGTKVVTEDGEKWDLNRPMGLEGRVTYCNERKPALQPVHEERLGVVVARKKLEPMRENEARWALPSCSLMNYQGEATSARGEWKIRQLASKDLELCRSYEGETVLKPLTWDEELREQGVAPSLRRTDSTFVCEYWCEEDQAYYFSRPR
nr:MAG: putative RNA-dependent RNA polymerase [Narnaviridae sp.]